MNKCTNKTKKLRKSHIEKVSLSPRPKYFHLLAKRMSAPNTGGIQVDEDIELEEKKKKNQTRRTKHARKINTRNK